MRLRLSPSRVATGVVLGAWAAFFWFLMVSGRWALYLSTRTFWVVPTGAVLLTIATVGRLATARVARPEPLPSATSWPLGVGALPVGLLLVLPPATLSGYALGRRAGFVGSGVSVSSSDIASGAISFIDVAAAQSSKSGMAALRSRAGEQATMALDALFIAYSKNARLPRATEIRSAINGMYAQLENPSLFDPGDFARRMRALNALLH